METLEGAILLVLLALVMAAWRLHVEKVWDEIRNETPPAWIHVRNSRALGGWRCFVSYSDPRPSDEDRQYSDHPAKLDQENRH